MNCLRPSYKLLVFLIAGWIPSLGMQVYAQDRGLPNIQNFKPSDYGASSSNYAVVQDYRGVMYFGNYRGILSFNGVDWNLIGLPQNQQVRSMAADSLGRVYAGSVGIFGMLRPDSLGNMQFWTPLDTFQGPRPNYSDFMAVTGTERGIWARSMTRRGKLYHWDGETLTFYTSPSIDRVDNMFFLHGFLFAAVEETGLEVWMENDFVPLPGSQALSGLQITNMLPMGPRGMLLFTAKKGIYKILLEQRELKVEKLQTEIDDVLEEGQTGRTFLDLGNGYYLFSSARNGVYIIDAEGKVHKHITADAGLQDNIVQGGLVDEHGDIWLALSKGISRLGWSSDLSVWGESSGLEGIVFNTTRHQGVLYATTPFGVFYLQDGRFFQVKNLNAESWQLLQLKEHAEAAPRLFVSAYGGFYEIRDKKAQKVRPGLLFYNVYQSPAYPKHVFNLAGPRGFVYMAMEKGRWGKLKKIQGIKGSFKSMALRPNGELWMVKLLQKGEVVRYQLNGKDSWYVAEEKHFGEADGLPPTEGVFHFGEEVVFATEKGLFRYDAQQDTFLLDTRFEQDSVMDSGVLRFREGPSGRIWIERNYQSKRDQQARRWIEVAVPQPDGTYFLDQNKLKGLASSEVWGDIYEEENGLAWIGTPEGLYCLQEKDRNPALRQFESMIRKVMIGEDSLIFAGAFPKDWSKPVIPYKNNALTFHYNATFYQGAKELRFSYLLQGRDEHWSPWVREVKKDYTLLPPGKYEFLVKAQNIYGQESAPQGFSFTILPPWYRTTWAFIAYALLAVFLVYGTVKLNTQRLHLQNENLERVVYERTSELWAQHKEIIKKSAALKRQKEEIAKQHDELGEKNEALEKALTKLKAAQTQLVEAEKMASLGQLTAGIAHEINNPINFVKGNINPLKRDFAEIRELFQRALALKTAKDLLISWEELEAYRKEIDADYLFEEMELLLNGIEEGAVRTKQIVDGLKIFSRTEQDQFKLADVHQGLDATLTLLSNQLKDRVEVHKDYVDMPMVECYPGKLNQVFMNILSNAVYAIEDRALADGKTLQTQELLGNIYLSTELFECETSPQRECVRIKIQDDGKGMPPEVAQKIFDPFFTTKEVGEGTGLGLSITFGIVEQHHGDIEVSSEPGKGTTFTIELPLRQPEEEVPIEVPATDDSHQDIA
ncbi:MAG: ATP-binding protein [Bacteroidota bacterium]